MKWLTLDYNVYDGGDTAVWRILHEIRWLKNNSNIGLILFCLRG